MGAVGGSIWHFVKGARNSPRGARLMGAVDLVKIRAPAIGGSFAIWGGLFSTFDCAFAGLRKKEDPWNAIMSGAMTGGVLAARQGAGAALRSAAFGGVILAIIEGVGIVFMRMASDMGPPPEEIQRQQEEALERQRRELATIARGSPATGPGAGGAPYFGGDDGLASVGQWANSR
mmetsp:Transcript_10092/g.20411  ORF Transcript_10092/g.20411 Transcript_10092/m.20411 type:complete len:175 (+) Transcript_10092:307-831(+)